MSLIRNVSVGNWPTDLFHRLQTATPATVFESRFTYDLVPLLWQTTTASGATVAHVPLNGCARAAITSTLGSKVVLQTYQYHHYQPGRAHQIRMTFMAPWAVNSTARMRVGYFDDANGVFYERVGSTHYFVVRKTINSVLSEERVAQASWSIDKLNGFGPSGVTLDGSFPQILLIDAQWLGVGSVLFGFDIDGQAAYCHQFNHANRTSGLYARTFNLPLRVEIENVDGSADAAGSYVEAYCNSVVSSGGDHEPHGFQFFARNDVFRTCPVGGLPLLSIRPKLTFQGQTNRILASLVDFSGFSDSNHNGVFELRYNSTVTGGAWVDVDGTNSAFEYNITATTWSGGVPVAGSFASRSSGGPVSENISGKFPLALSIDGLTQRNYTVVGFGLGGNRDMVSDITWLEHR